MRVVCSVANAKRRREGKRKKEKKGDEGSFTQPEDAGDAGMISSLIYSIPYPRTYG